MPLEFASPVVSASGSEVVHDELHFRGYAQPPNPPVPPDPTGEDWRGPPGPAGPPGAPGPPTPIISADTPPVGADDNTLWWDSAGLTLYYRYNDGNSSQWVSTAVGLSAQYLPIYYTATGGTTPRSAYDRAADTINALDFGIICDGVTDQGAQLNAALASLGRGRTLYIPGSIYTTVTIRLADGQRLEMPPLSVQRPSVGSPLMVTTRAIIGSSTLSPVVMVTGGEGGLTNVAITRNGTPAAGSIGLQCFGQDHIYRSVYSYNHARCIQIGAPRSAMVDGTLYYAITTRFDHCMTWNSTEDSVYLLNAPETTFYDHRFGIVGETSPNLGNSLVCIDGDANDSSAGATNTVSFIRCQFNPGATVPHLYSVRCISWNYGVLKFAQCYSGGATNAFLYIDPSCTRATDVSFIGNTISPMSGTETLISDSGHKLIGLKMIGNWIDGGASPGLSLSGISAQIIGNSFGGPFVMVLDAMTSGVCIGNSINTLTLTGVFAGNFLCSNNNVTTFNQTATGALSYNEPRGNYGAQMRLGKTGQGGRVDFARGSDGGLAGWVGMNAATGVDLGAVLTTGSPVVYLDARNTGGIVSLRSNSVERFSVSDTAAALSVPFSAGVSFGAGVGSSSSDTSRHITLHTSGFGLGITSARLNLVCTGTSGIWFNAGGTDMGSFTTTTGLTIGAAGAPNIRSGTGAATGTQPSGSLWLRTDGSAGARLYVSQGGGTWVPVASV